MSFALSAKQAMAGVSRSAGLASAPVKPAGLKRGALQVQHAWRSPSGQSPGPSTLARLGADATIAPSQVSSGLKETRDRIGSVNNTRKITSAMKLVAAAKVRRAQEAVINGRPFNENLVKVRPRGD